MGSAWQHGRVLLRAAILSLGLLWAAPVAADVHGLQLPRGSRQIAQNHYGSSRTFRRTVKFYQRLLKRRASPHRAVPIYRYRGVAVARFVSQSKGSRWSAIHVFRADGRTQIYIVPGKEGLDGPQKPR